MDLNKLRTLVTVAEVGNFTRASKIVNLTQSAVSQQLKELEINMGTKLLDRSSRPATLTNAGVELVTTARKILQLWQEYQEAQTQKEYVGKLVIGYIRSSMTDVLANALNSLQDKHSKLVVMLINAGGVTRHLVEKVDKNEMDACICVEPAQIPKGLFWRPYSMERFYVISRPGLKMKTDEELLSQGPYLRFAPLLSETMIDREIKKRGISVKTSMELDSYSSILLMVKHGMGTGIIPESYLKPKDHDLVSCTPFGAPPLIREMGILVRHDNPNKQMVQALWKAMYRYANQQIKQ